MKPVCFFSDSGSDLNPYLTRPQLIAVGEKLTAKQAMSLAITEAYRGTGFVSPNPLVGCVILDAENRFLVSGYHAQVGQAHAEAQALQKVTREKLQGATVYVTLEPCAHQGRTPSCAKTLVQYPIAQVVYGLRDPNPLVAGQGAEILKQAGIRVSLYSELYDDPKMIAELEQVAEHFLWNFRQKKVYNFNRDIKRVTKDSSGTMPSAS